MRVQLRIVAGSLRGRKLHCNVHPGLRPAPERLREALFNILGDAVPGQPFFDVFAGTGAVGLEAISRGAQPVVLVERDLRTATEIERHIATFGVAELATVVRADAYRWAEKWPGCSEPCHVFLGPPYPDFERRLDALLLLVADLQQKVASESVLVLQSEKTIESVRLPGGASWEVRRYGRNQLLIWVKP